MPTVVGSRSTAEVDGDAEGAISLVDAHCHLNHERFGAEAAAVAEAARAAGVVRLLVPGWNAASSERAVSLARELGWVDAAIGIHPHDAAKADEAAWARIEALVLDPVVVAVGETGLDYDRLFSPVDAQLENLDRHLELALRVGKPIVLHCRSKPGRRDAQDALLDVLRRWRAVAGTPTASSAPRPRAILHSFSGPVDYGLEALRLGCLVSFSGLVFRTGEGASAEVARLAPEDAVLVETDAPFLAPPGVPRSRNEPGWVRVTARWLAEVRGADPRALGSRFVATYDACFARAAQAGAARPEAGESGRG
ncbi:MAG: TatD family hydrolase [Chloroflexota bacterium]|nr:MAG: TatD family hydrolase [Chloroflexota bacterium]